MKIKYHHHFWCCLFGTLFSTTHSVVSSQHIRSTAIYCWPCRVCTEPGTYQFLYLSSSLPKIARRLTPNSGSGNPLSTNLATGVLNHNNSKHFNAATFYSAIKSHVVLILFYWQLTITNVLRTTHLGTRA